MSSARIPALVFAFAFAGLVPAQTDRKPDRKAIVIGINCYEPDDPARPDCASLTSIPEDRSAVRYGTYSGGNWPYWKYPNLKGAVNDALMMRAVLKTREFEIPDDAFITDGRATASEILRVLRKYLIEDTKDARPDDVRIVYYSGHGNYLRNLASASAEDKYDESIVPSDHWRGTPDIRDKELSRIFTQASKQVRVIFIADSCHSGSVMRGAGGTLKAASAGSADAPEAPKVTDKAPVDESFAHGLIAVSAARRDQPALETESHDVNDPESGPHGAFTWALHLALIGQMDAPLDRLFNRTSALLSLDRPNQVPDLNGKDRSSISLFGDAAGAHQQQTAAVQNVSGDDARLRAGRAIGIYKGTELTRTAPAGRPTLVIRVTEEEGLDSSKVHVAEHGPGNYAMRDGDVFRVDKWVVPTQTMLSVRIPPSMPAARLSSAVAELGKLKAQLGKRWIDDETEATPSHILRWDGNTWLLEKGDFEQGGVKLGAAPDATAIVQQLPADAKLFVALPPAQELTNFLPFGKTDNKRIYLADTSGGANYRLRGRIYEGAAEYSWIQPTVNTADVKAIADKLQLPVRTDWEKTSTDPALKETARSLGDKAYRLGRLREWQMLPAVGDSDKAFPYRLEIREVTSQKPIQGNIVIGKQKYKVFLKGEPSLKPSTSVTPRYVYVFAIDQYGKGTLIWPLAGQGNQDNLFPAPAPENETKAPTPLEIAVSGSAPYDFEVGEPYGNDSYMLLTSVQRLDNPDVLDFDGVRTVKAASRGATESPLSDLLSQIGTLSRGNVPRIPTDWNIQTLVLHSEAPPDGK